MITVLMYCKSFAVGFKNIHPFLISISLVGSSFDSVVSAYNESYVL